MSSQQCHDVVIVFRRDRFPSSHPGVKLGVAVLQQALEAVKLPLVERGEMAIGKAAEQQIALAGAPVPSPESKAFPPDLDGFFSHSRYPVRAA